MENTFKLKYKSVSCSTLDIQLYMINKMYQLVTKIGLFIFVYISNFLYWSVKSKSLGFLIGVNPGIHLGGTVGYSKYALLRQLSPIYIPNTILLWKAVTPDEVSEIMEKNNLIFPIILKPDTGLQNSGVRIIYNDNDLKNYLIKNQSILLLQEYIDKKSEYAVLYYKFPGNKFGNIFSYSQRLRNEKGLAGNTCINLNSYINPELEYIFDSLSKNIKGFYFGRFDILADSLEDMKYGNFKIVEVNGAASIPLHLYDTHFSIRQRRREFKNYWKILYRISKDNALLGSKKNGSTIKYFKELRIALWSLISL